MILGVLSVDPDLLSNHKLEQSEGKKKVLSGITAIAV